MRLYEDAKATHVTHNPRRFTGVEFALVHAQPPTLFIIQKRERLSPEEGSYAEIIVKPGLILRMVLVVRPLAAYFVMNNRIYQSPDVYTLLSNRLVLGFSYGDSLALDCIFQLTSLNSLQSSLDTLRKYRPNYTPRTGFIWPIVDTFTSDATNKKPTGEEMLSSSADGDSTASQLDKQRPAGSSVPRKQQAHALMFNAMNTTALHSTLTFTSQRNESDSNPPESVAAGTSGRNSVTPAPVARGTTPIAPSIASTQQDSTAIKGPAGGGKKKKKRSGTVLRLGNTFMTLQSGILGTSLAT